MGAVTRPGRRIKCRVGVVSLTASLYNSHLPQFANPTVVNPKASSTKQMGKGGLGPGSPRRARLSGGWGLPILLAPEQSKAKRARDGNSVMLRCVECLSYIAFDVRTATNKPSGAAKKLLASNMPPERSQP